MEKENEYYRMCPITKRVQCCIKCVGEYCKDKGY